RGFRRWVNREILCVCVRERKHALHTQHVTMVHSTVLKPDFPHITLSNL
ncbi:MAG: hypothetical protein ACI90V_003825, partial [Bacillariaceae sp.]